MPVSSNEKSHKSHLSKDFICLSLLVIVVFMLLVVWFAYKTYKEQSSSILRTLENQTSRINSVFIDAIDYTAQSMSYMGKQLERNGTDPTYINKLFETYRVPNNEIVAYSTFSWVDKNYNLTVSSNKGIMPNPDNLASRDYIPATVNYPYKIQLGSPVYGSTSKLWSIPAGMGIVNTRGRHLGTIVTGFVISSLNQKLEKAINNDSVNFILLDKDFVLIAASSHIKSDNQLLNTLRKVVTATISTSKMRSGVLSAPTLFNNDNQFAYYQATGRYPYTIITIYDKTLSNALINRAILEFILQSLVIAALIILLLYMTRKLLLSPILTLSGIADNITKGNLDTPIPQFYSIEINNLAQQLQNIKEDKKELKKAHLAVKRANAQLESKVKKRTASLQQALNAKDEFLNNMSHEIRLPTGVVMGRADMLLEDWEELEEADKKEHVEEIYASCKRLFGLLNNLLDLAKSKAGKMTYTMVPCDLAEIAGQVIDELGSLTSSKKLSIHCENGPNLPLVMLDPMRIAQVIRNLLSNAIKFTAEGTLTITITPMPLTDIDGRNVAGLGFAIKDQGVGVPPEELSKIFDVFIQSSKTRTGAGGTGLGLSICKEIITAHHGIIRAENNQPEKGTTFTFIVPTGGR
jgi:two-component system sensor histidine kinase ChiS